MLSGLVLASLTIIPWYKHEVKPVDFTGSLVVCETRDEMAEYMTKSLRTPNMIESKHGEMDGCALYTASERDAPVTINFRGRRYQVTGVLFEVRVVAEYENDIVRGNVLHVHSPSLSGYSFGSVEFLSETAQVEK